MFPLISDNLHPMDMVRRTVNNSADRGGISLFSQSALYPILAGVIAGV